MEAIEMHLSEKARVRIRRKQKFSVKPDQHIRRKHWVNHAGTYKDEEQRKGPKWWHGKKPTRYHRSIKGYKELIQALKDVLAGKKNQDHYMNIPGLTRERLRVTQSLRDRGQPADLSLISRAGHHELRTLRRYN